MTMGFFHLPKTGPVLGSRTLLKELLADGARVTFESGPIPTNGRGIGLELFLVGHGATLIARCNGDVGANYQRQDAIFANTAGTFQQGLTTTGMNINPTLGGDSNFWGEMLNYNSAAVKQMFFRGVWGGIGTGSGVVSIHNGEWNNAAIVSLMEIICGTAPTAGFVRWYLLN